MSVLRDSASWLFCRWADADLHSAKLCSRLWIMQPMILIHQKVLKHYYREKVTDIVSFNACKIYTFFKYANRWNVLTLQLSLSLREKQDTLNLQVYSTRTHCRLFILNCASIHCGFRILKWILWLFYQSEFRDLKEN